MDDYRMLAEDPEWVEYQEARRTGRTSRERDLDAIADLTARTGGYQDEF